MVYPPGTMSGEENMVYEDNKPDELKFMQELFSVHVKGMMDLVSEN